MHQKNILKALVLWLALAAIFPLSARAATFSDVPAGNRNYTAIEYLAGEGIISGYPDLTFQPARAVSRVEFLKLAIESSKSFLTTSLTTDPLTSSGFSDIDESAWYGKYVRIAKMNGWIEGYDSPAGKIFKPDQTINKAEGLAIIGRIQQWPVSTQNKTTFLDTPFSTWFGPFVAYAKVHNYLEESGNYFFPAALLSRGKVSEILFRVYISKKAAAQTFSEGLIPTPAPTLLPAPAPENYRPIPYQDYPADYFTNIKLTGNFPNTFYQNEVYFFEGAIQNGNYQEAFVFIKDETSGKIENSTAAVNGNTVSIPFHFSRSGNYKLGLILGASGESRVVSIAVLPAPPSSAVKSAAPAIPAAPTLEFNNDATTFHWIKTPNMITKLYLSQGTQKRTYLFRQSRDSYAIRYGDFKDFSAETVTYQLEKAFLSPTSPLTIQSEWSVSQPLQLTPAIHQFRETDENAITFSNLPETLPGPGPVSFTGKAKTDLFQMAAVQRPDGNVEMLQLKTSQPTTTFYGEAIIPAGNDYSFEYMAKTPGTYILEINNKNGSAVINVPLYVQTGIPLLPDFFDLPQEAETSAFDQQTLRLQMLKLINEERVRAGYSTLVMADDLNTLALQYANDMAARNFFSHIDPEGLGPNDRRMALKIPTEVSENLAQSPNLRYAHYGFLRSPIHRKNIITAKWERVGLGFAKNKNGDLLVVQEFSTFPMTSAQLRDLSQTFIQKINQKRQSNGLSTLMTNDTLTALAEDWSAMMVEQKFFSFKAPDGSIFANLLQSKIGNVSSKAFILESTNQEKIVEQLLSEPEILESFATKIGLGIRFDEVGKFKLTAIFTK